MQGRIFQADRPARAPTWQAPLVLGGNAATYAIVRASGLRARVMWSGREVLAARGPSLLLAWHRCNYALTVALRALPPEDRPTLLMHDGFASRALTHRSATWAGFDVLVFTRRSARSPREQIAAFLRETRRALLVLPDAGGPYGRVKPGSLEIARAAGARIVPIGVVARPAIEIGRALRHVIPLPGGRIDVYVGAPIAPEEATVEVVQRALDALALRP